MHSASRHSLVLLTVFAVPVLLTLIALGAWQVQRLYWKEALVARLQEREAAEPVDLLNGLVKADLGLDVEFLRVQGNARRLPGNELKLYWVQDGQVGWRLFAPYELPDGTGIIADRGFVTDEVLKDIDLATGPTLIRGRLRAPETQGLFTPDNEPDRNIWYWRDLGGMARALGMNREKLAPVFVTLERADAGISWPKATASPPDLPNRHLGYALTWFGLALCLLGVYAAYIYKSLRSNHDAS